MPLMNTTTPEAGRNQHDPYHVAISMAYVSSLLLVPRLLHFTLGIKYFLSPNPSNVHPDPFARECRGWRGWMRR